MKKRAESWYSNSTVVIAAVVIVGLAMVMTINSIAKKSTEPVTGRVSLQTIGSQPLGGGSSGGLSGGSGTSANKHGMGFIDCCIDYDLIQWTDCEFFAWPYAVEIMARAVYETTPGYPQAITCENFNAPPQYSGSVPLVTTQENSWACQQGSMLCPSTSICGADCEDYGQQPWCCADQGESSTTTYSLSSFGGGPVYLCEVITNPGDGLQYIHTIVNVMPHTAPMCGRGALHEYQQCVQWDPDCIIAARADIGGIVR